MDPIAIFACDPKILSAWDWDRCWCGWRLYVLFPLAAVGLWFLCMNVGFLRVSIPPDGKPKLWPRDAFWRWVGWWVLLTTTAFVGIFTLLSDELRRTAWKLPSTGAPWLNSLAPPTVILVGGLVAMFLCRLVGYYSRPRQSRPRPAAPVAQP